MAEYKEYNHRDSHAFQIDRIDLAVLLTQVRASKGLTVRDLSIKSDVIASIITNIEVCKASPSFFTISKIFNAMDLSIAEAYSMIENSSTVS